jgi:hypothetical protein
VGHHHDRPDERRRLAAMVAPTRSTGRSCTAARWSGPTTTTRRVTARRGRAGRERGAGRVRAGAVLDRFRPGQLRLPGCATTRPTWSGSCRLSTTS